MKTITKKYIADHFKKNDWTPRHSFDALKKSCNKLARETKLNAADLFHLLVENQPIPGAYTHSYGFHTREGRFLIETLQSYYYNFNR